MDSESLSFDSSQRLRIFSLLYVCDEMKKHISLFLYQAQNLHLSYSIYMNYIDKFVSFIHS